MRQPVGLVQGFIEEDGTSEIMLAEPPLHSTRRTGLTINDLRSARNTVAKLR